MRALHHASSTAILVACALSSACATTRYTQSRIAAPEARGKGREAVCVEVEGLGVRVVSLDRAPRGERVPNLALRLVFDPREIGYSFDPGQVVLRGPDGREWRGAGGGYQPLYPKAQFDLAFDVAVEPEARMELVLDGLARGAKRLAPVRLRLGRHRGTSIDRLYWLEAIGYMLMAGA